MIDQVLWSLLALAGVGGSALCSGAEIGLYTVNRIRLNLRVGGKAGAHDRSAHTLKRELDRPERALATLLIANTLFNNLGALGISGLLRTWGLSDWQVIAVTSAVLTPLLFIFAETLPKELFRVEADRLTYYIARPLAAARLLLTAVAVLPLVQGFMRLINALTRRKVNLTGDESRQRIADLLKEGAGFGVISESQATLVDRALAFRWMTIADEMTPWTAVRTIRVDTRRRRVIELISRWAFSRYPLVDSAGRVIGVVEHLDVLLNPESSLQDLAKRPMFLSPTMSVRDGLAQMRDRGERIAVVGAARRPLGIVTAKDLVEPLTGELAGL